MPGGATAARRRGGGRNYNNPMMMYYSGIGADAGGNGPEHDFGNGGLTYYVQPPSGCDLGQVKEIQVSVTETFTADTTAGLVQVGISGDLSKYAELSLGTAATAGASYGSYDTGIFTETDSNPGFIYFSSDGATIITYVAPTGGTPAGKGYVFIAIGWW